MKQSELFRAHPEYRHPKPPPARLKLARSDPREAEILSSVLQALNFYPSVAWFVRCNSAAGRLVFPDGTVSQFMRFGFPGCPDILGMLKGGKLLAIEVKSPTGRVSEAQAAFLETVSAHGGLAFVARSVSDLKQRLCQK